MKPPHPNRMRPSPKKHCESEPLHNEAAAHEENLAARALLKNGLPPSARAERWQLLQVFADAIPSPVMGVDDTGEVIVWNSAAASRTGMDSARAKGRPLGAAAPEYAFLLPHIARALDLRQTCALSRALPCPPDGAERLHTITICPLNAPGVSGALVHMDDVEFPEHMKEIMARTEKMFSVCGLAAGMAHEINTPLGGVLQGAQNILRRLDPELPANITTAQQLGCDLQAMQAYMEQRGIRHFLEGVRESGSRAAAIVAAMLEFSHDTTYAKTCVSPRQLVHNALRLASLDYSLKKHCDFKKIAIEEEYQPDLPQLLCSPLEIEQVLLNLFKNAAQAMAQEEPRPGGPRIGIRVYREGGYLRFDISDTGPGIPDASLARVFEPFYTTKPSGEGTGLGIPVSNFIITNKHNGTFSVSSHPGSGTTFSITLPID